MTDNNTVNIADLMCRINALISAMREEGKQTRQLTQKVRQLREDMRREREES